MHCHLYHYAGAAIVSAVRAFHCLLRLLVLALLLPGLVAGAPAESLNEDSDQQLQDIVLEQPLALAAWEDGSADGSTSDGNPGATVPSPGADTGWDLPQFAIAPARRLGDPGLPRAPPA